MERLGCKPRRRGIIKGETMAKLMGIRIDQLRPLQATVGMLEIDAKRKRLLDMNEKDLKAFLKAAPDSNGGRQE
ncbi:hypothetical protein OKW49_007940 [Paraburkholderia youngii]|uniref:ParB-like protein n=1 Tax=Paraburkholderia youngii TaxID=2782701 RepID=UPI003D1C8B30